MWNKQEVSAASYNYANETSTGACDNFIRTGRNLVVNKGSSEHFAEGWVGVVCFAPHTKNEHLKLLRPISTFPLIHFYVFFLFFFFLLYFWRFWRKTGGINSVDLGNITLVWFDIAMLQYLYLTIPHFPLSVIHLTQVSWIIKLFCMGEGANVKRLKISRVCRKHKIPSLSFQVSPGISASFNKMSRSARIYQHVSFPFRKDGAK